VSIYYVNKFLYQVDADPELLGRYKAAPEELLSWWEAERGLWLNTAERTTWLRFSDIERRALINHDYVTLFELGAHFFLSLTIFIAIYDADYTERLGPLSFQREYAANLAHWAGKDYPSVAL